VNSTVKSLAFWMVLIVVALLVWNFSAKFQSKETSVTFSEFISWVDSGQVARVTITGSEISGITKANENFRTYAPLQYEGLANRLIERNVIVNAKPEAASPWTALLYSWAPIL
jgi:cell division protease FtsH